MYCWGEASGAEFETGTKTTPSREGSSITESNFSELEGAPSLEDEKSRSCNSTCNYMDTEVLVHVPVTGVGGGV